MAEEESCAISWRSACVLLMICFAEGLSMNFYTTIASLMVRYEFGIEEKQVGFYVGYITTAFFLGQFISNFPLSWISDRLGRKPTLLGGLFFNIILQICFGMSKWLWLAILMRFINGLLNCNIPVTKCFVRETSDVSNQARMFSFREVGYAVGAMIAPLIGSIFSRPCDQSWLSKTFLNSDFFEEYPYALVCYIASAIDIICLIIGIIFMRETLPSKVKKEENEENEIEMEEITSEDIVEDTEHLMEDIESVLPQEVKESNEEEENISDVDVLVNDYEQSSKKVLSKINSVIVKFSFLNQGTVICIILYMIMSLAHMMIVQTYPVWVSRSPEEHGLDFEERQIGILNSIGAGVALIFQLLFFSPIDKFFGPSLSYRIATVLYIPILFLFPFIFYIYSFYALMWISAILLVSSIYANLSWTFGEINVLISNSAPSNSVGSVNGIATALAALARIIGPVFGTSIFAWSANLDWYYPFNFMLTFHIGAVLTGCCLALSYFIPKKIDNSRHS